MGRIWERSARLVWAYMRRIEGHHGRNVPALELQELIV